MDPCFILGLGIQNPDPDPEESSVSGLMLNLQ